jgi:hypothetical protein
MVFSVEKPRPSGLVSAFGGSARGRKIVKTAHYASLKSLKSLKALNALRSASKKDFTPLIRH